MPKIKPTSPKKSPLKASKKPSAKKANAKGGDVDTHLHQAFISSVHQLEKHWDKKVQSVKKQLESLKDKLEKSQLKQKAVAKGKSASHALKEKMGTLQSDIAQWRQDHSFAKIAAAKYSHLRKTIDAVEREWLGKLAETTLPAKAEKMVKTAQKTLVEKAKAVQPTKTEKSFKKATKKAKTVKAQVKQSVKNKSKEGKPVTPPIEETAPLNVATDLYTVEEALPEESVEEFSFEEDFDHYNS